MQESSDIFLSGEVTFSERPPYDPGTTDALFSRYCTISALPAEKAVAKKGVDVAKRKEAILAGLRSGSKPVHVFGELEFGLISGKPE